MTNRRKLVAAFAVGVLLAAGAGGAALAMAGQGGRAPNGPQAGAGMMGSGAGMGPGVGMGGMSGMHGMQVGSEFAYLAGMIPHHEEAIATAKEVLARSDRPEMREFAASIIEGQSAQVVEMQDYLARWYPGRDATVDYEPMMGDLTQLSGDELDRAFLERMIPHHGMAVMMSQQLLGQALAEHVEVSQLAATIRDDQRAEIMMMMRWLRTWYGVSGHGHG